MEAAQAAAAAAPASLPQRRQAHLRQLPRSQRGLRAALGDLPLQRHLHHCQHVWQGVLRLVHGPQQGKQVVRGGVAHEDEVVGGVFVVAGHIEGHHALQEGLAGLRGESGGGKTGEAGKQGRGRQEWSRMGVVGGGGWTGCWDGARRGRGRVQRIQQWQSGQQSSCTSSGAAAARSSTSAASATLWYEKRVSRST